ncbi:Ca2+-binding RTX toxin-like protein [Bradyrhizobium sp. AZCC 1578]|uniref:hypothetical protein n=1 Tax=Bradyrhizobium sp. AZCC 1578 TaxID=3117027 RepID=UPI002FF35405
MATIFGTSGNDTLTGTSANDSIYGQAGEDTLTGGLGNYTLQGGLGSDTYVFNLGDGQDTILDYGAGSGEINTLQFGSAIAPAQVSVKQSGSGDLVLSITGTTPTRSRCAVSCCRRPAVSTRWYSPTVRCGIVPRC